MGRRELGAELQKVSSSNIFKEDLRRNVRTELRSVVREQEIYKYTLRL